MTFLPPFAAFAVWLWLGRRRRQPVPFLPLWDAPSDLRRPRRGVEPPPLGLVFALLATLCALLAAARPRLTSPTHRGRITILVDRGASMSALVNNKPRFAQLAAEIAPLLKQQLGEGPVELLDPITGQTTQTDRSDWPTPVSTWKRTALDTTALLRAAVQHHLDQHDPTIVLTDRPLDDLASEQLILLSPHEPVANAGITALACRAGQVMVTLQATIPTQRTLRLTSGDQTTTQSIALKPNEPKTLFLNLTPGSLLGQSIDASLEPPDAFDADDHARLARRQPWPLLEPRIPLSDELHRLIDVYARHRPPAPDAPHLPLARPGDLKPDEPGLLLPIPAATESSLPADISTRPHPLTAGVDFSPLRAGIALAAANPPGDGWTKLAWTADRTLLAARESPARQVWINLDSRPFAQSPAFVILWSNCFDWTANGATPAAAETWAAQPVATPPDDAQRTTPTPPDADPTLWPGLFQTPRGPLAQNATATTFSTGPALSAARLATLHPKSPAGADLTPALALAALASLLLAAATWEKRRPPAHWTKVQLAVDETAQPVQS